jgi:oligopeptide/dipeptide ABC transporter ATP-binding protein
MESIPKIDGISGQGEYPKVMPGVVPSLYDLPKGCSFQDRYSHIMEMCREAAPQLKEKSFGHKVRCWLYE